MHCLVGRQPRELRLPLHLFRLPTLTRWIPDEAERRQPRRPRHRHPIAGLAAVELPLAHPLRVDPVAELQVLCPVLRHLAVAVRRLVRRQQHQLRLPLGVVQVVA